MALRPTKTPDTWPPLTAVSFARLLMLAAATFGDPGHAQTSLLMALQMETALASGQASDRCTQTDTYVFSPGKKPTQVETNCSVPGASHRPEDTHVFKKPLTLGEKTRPGAQPKTDTP